MLGRAYLYRMSDATAYLRRQARRIAAAYQAFAVPRAILLVGSAASGDADEYSDIDLLLLLRGGSV
jgi:predicted nucleotidyltransferase